jgi:hypothetical protein
LTPAAARDVLASVRRHAPYALAAAALCLTACNNDPPKADPSAAQPTAAAQPGPPSSAAAVAKTGEAAPIKPPEGPPACASTAKKTWASGVNKITGLATTELADGRVAVGLAIGNQPHVLVVGPGGDGKLLKVPVKAGSALGKPLKADEGARTLYRVTPVKVEGDKAQAFVDYREERKDKRRRVACGPADADAAWINFDDVPYLDRDPKPTGKDLEALFKKHEHEEGEKHEEGDDGYHELRDCRSFADVRTGETWIVGSVLRGVQKAEGAIEWSASLVVDTGPQKHEIHLHEVVLKGDPPNLKNFEVPISRSLGDKGYLLAARFGGSLRAGLLNPDKTLKGKLMNYAGFPTLPHAATDAGDVVLVTAVTKDKGLFALRGLRVSMEKPALPKALTVIDTHAADKGHTHDHGHDHDQDHVDHSETDPDFVRDSNGKRWVAYIEGERGKGQLQIVPVDEGLQAVGKPFAVTASAELASEARLLPLEGGALLVVSLREGETGLEVVTEELRCQVMKE